MQTLFGERTVTGARILRILQGRARQAWFAGGLAGAIALHAARASLDEALGALHPANEPAYGTNRLHDGPKAAARALSSWDRGSADFAGFLRGRLDGRVLARLHTLAETGYTLLASGLLLALVAWVFNRLGDDDPDVTRLRRGILRWAGLLVPVYLFLGLLDQLLDGLLLWAEPSGSPPRLTAGAASAARLLQASSIIRRLTLAAIVVPLAIGLLAIARQVHPGRRLLAAGSPYRVLIAVIALYALILDLGPPGEQAADAIRLWSHSLRLTVVALVAVFWLSATVFVIARRVGRSGEPPGPPPSEWAITGRLAATGVTLIGIGFGIERLRHWGGGIGVLGALLTVVAGLNALLLLVVPPEPPGMTGATRTAAVEITAQIPVTPGLDEDGNPLDPAREPGEPAPAKASPFLPSLLGFLPFVVLGRAILRAAIPEAISPDGSLLLVPVCLLVLVTGCVLFVISRRPTFFAVESVPARFDTAFRSWLLGSVGVLVAIAVWTWLHPWSIGRLLGVHGMLPAFLTGLTVAVGGMSYLTERWSVPSALRLVGIRRVPIVSTILAWAIGASMLASNYHDIRTIDGVAPTTGRTLTAETAFAAWAGQAIPGTATPGATAGASGGAPAPTIAGRKPAVPMVLVAAAGGGIRAAGFTALTLDCLLARIDSSVCPQNPLAGGWGEVFALSGASGGSVGIASVRAQLDAEQGDADQWVAERLGGDMLSASLAWQLFVEAPNVLLRFSPDMDRGEVIERSWERRWAGTGASSGTGAVPTATDAAPQSAAAAGRTTTGEPATPGNPATQGVLGADGGWTGPLLLLNGTNLRDSCRVNLSRLDGADPIAEAATASGAEQDCRRQRLDETPPGRTTLAVTRDLVDYLCPDEDIRLSTAAFGSARFPFVSPTADLRSAPDRGRNCAKPDLPPLAVGDSGYRDNTGAGALLELWSQVAPLVEQHNRVADTCIVPVLIEIDNGHRNRNAVGDAGRLGQLAAPLSGALSVFGSRDAGWIEQAADEFSRELGPGVRVLDARGTPVTDRFTRLSLFAHPGVQAPLGWSLSPEAVADITAQLAVAENASAIDEVVGWLTPGGLSCEVA